MESPLHPEHVQELNRKYLQLKSEIARVIVGQEAIVNDLLITLFCRGHALLVGVPGLAKTLLVSTLSQLLDLKFNRIQFTPDLMPSDILGSEFLNQNREFQFLPGPIFAQIILADEINRTPPKTQAALLEAMQEKSVTIAGQTRPLSKPFFVLATQNPIEQEGTYPLPEAQLDRFMFNILLDYPRFEEELQVVRQTTDDRSVTLKPVMTAEEILAAQHLVRSLPIAESVLKAAVAIVAGTRPNTEKALPIANQYLQWGAGPRASQYLVVAAKCHAAIHGKYSPDEEDLFAIAPQVLRHRLVRNYKAEADGVSNDAIIAQLLKG